MLVTLQVERFYSLKNLYVGATEIKLNTVSFSSLNLRRIYHMHMRCSDSAVAFKEELEEKNTRWVYPKTLVNRF